MIRFPHYWGNQGRLNLKLHGFDSAFSNEHLGNIQHFKWRIFHMRKLMLLLAVLGLVGTLLAADPLLGTWKLNAAKSKFSPILLALEKDVAPKETTMVIQNLGTRTDRDHRNGHTNRWVDCFPEIQTAQTRRDSGEFSSQGHIFYPYGDQRE